jgi:hypothetical protein
VKSSYFIRSQYRQIPAVFAGIGIWSPEYRYSGIGIYRIGNTRRGGVVVSGNLRSRSPRVIIKSYQSFLILSENGQKCTWIIFGDYYVAFRGLLLYLDSFRGLLRCFLGIFTVPG